MNRTTIIKLISFGFLAASVLLIVIASLSYINIKSSNIEVKNLEEKAYKDAMNSIYVGWGVGSIFTVLAVYLLATSTCEA
jgi:uncharacterized metal-binding protein